MNIKKSAIKIFLLIAFGATLPTIAADAANTPADNKTQKKLVVVSENIYDKNKIPKRVQRRIEKIVNTPSNLAGFANFKRKTKQQRIRDNIAWYKKHGKVNNEYNRYGLDIKNYRDQNNYMTREELDRFAVHHGNVNPEDYKERLDDKILFDQIVRKYYPEALVDVYFEFKGKQIVPRQNTLITDYTDTISALKSLDDGKYFIKELDGLCGNNAMVMTKQNGEMKFHHVESGDITLRDFWKITSKKNFLLQKYTENHADIKKLSPTALSTVRIVTTRFNDDVHILSSDLRVGCSKDSIVDNFAKEGAIIHVNAKTGRLSRYGFRKHKKIIDKHPISGIKFSGYKLPFWQESIELVKKLHNIFPEFSSVGWDIAITPSGPIVIEGNGNWDYTIPQTTVGGLKEKWEKAKKI